MNATSTIPAKPMYRIRMTWPNGKHEGYITGSFQQVLILPEQDAAELAASLQSKVGRTAPTGTVYTIEEVTA